MLRLEQGSDGAALRSVFGGKITAYRRLGAHALAKLLRAIGCPPEHLTTRLARAYGTRAWTLLGAARSMATLGENFGGG